MPSDQDETATVEVLQALGAENSATCEDEEMNDVVSTSTNHSTLTPSSQTPPQQ